jgi:hypothetical protein
MTDDQVARLIALVETQVATLIAFAERLRYDGTSHDRDMKLALANHVDSVIARYRKMSSYPDSAGQWIAERDVRELLEIAAASGMTP